MNAEPIAWIYPSAVWQTGGFHRHDPMFGTQFETWTFFTHDGGVCGCGRGCSFWASLYPPLPPDMEFPPIGGERCLQEPLPRPERHPFRVTGYFGAASSHWRNSLRAYPKPLRAC